MGLRFLAFLPVILLAGDSAGAAGWENTQAQYGQYTAQPKDPAAQIGQKGFITKEQLDGWQAAHGCYPEPMNGRHVAWIRLLELNVMEEVLRQYTSFEHFTLEELEEEEKRIDEGTRAPEILSCIKGSFGDRRYAYWRVFIAPLLIEKKFSSFIEKDPQVQGKTYALRDRVAELAKTVPDLKKISKQLTVDTSTHAFRYDQKTYSLQEPKKKKDTPPGPGDWTPGEAAFIKENLQNLSPGEVKKEPLENPSGFTFIRLIKKRGPRYTYESLEILRSAAEFTRTVKKIPVRLISIETEHKNWLKGVGNFVLSFKEWKD